MIIEIIVVILMLFDKDIEIIAAILMFYHMPNILDNSIPIENVHCLIYFLLG